jgi:hypothetical protein
VIRYYEERDEDLTRKLKKHFFFGDEGVGYHWPKE